MGCMGCTHAKLAPQTPYPLHKIISPDLCWNRRKCFGQATFLPNFFFPYSLVRPHSAACIHGCSVIGCYLMLSLTSLDCFFFCCWVTSSALARSSIGCWVAIATGGLCHSHTNSILWCIVKVTKMATWSLPLALLRMIGTKLSSLRGSSPISCRVVITSYQNNWNPGFSNRVCQTSSSRSLLLQLAHSGLSANFMWNRYALNAPWPDITWVRLKSICSRPLSNHTSWLCINRLVYSPFKLPFFPFIEYGMPVVLPDPPNFSTPWPNLTCNAVYTLVLIYNWLNGVGVGYTCQYASYLLGNNARHWHTLMQPSIGPKPSLFFGTPWHWCYQPRLSST